MPTNFLSLPSELRNDIYEQVLTGVSTSIKRELPKHDRRKKTFLGLVLANKRISLEASSVFYAATCFDLRYDDLPPEAVEWFEQIGRRNASFILDIRIDCPEFQHLSADGVTLDGKSEAILAGIRDYCKSLRTLTMVRYSTYHLETKLASLNDDGIAARALELIDERFRAVASLPEIIIELDKDDPNIFVRTEMRRREWRIVEIKDNYTGFMLFD